MERFSNRSFPSCVRGLGTDVYKESGQDALLDSTGVAL